MHRDIARARQRAIDELEEALASVGWRVATSTSVSAPSGIAVGYPMVVFVKVHAAETGAGAATGAVTVSTPSGVRTARVSNGMATFVLVNTSRGRQQLHATYAGSRRHSPSSAAMPYTVY